MEETFFSVEEAASILACSRWTVRRLITEGWLNGPPGGTKKERNARVSKKSLFQFMIIDRASRLPLKTLRELKNGRKKISRFLVQTQNANCLSMDEGTSEALEIAPSPNDPSPYPLPQGERGNNSHEKKRCLHHEFAEQHQFSFGWRARQLEPIDLALQDDLVQEMSLAVLEYDRPASFEFLMELASNRAKNYIKYEASRGMMSLSQARHASDTFAEKMGSLTALIDKLMKRGVPAEWIEEVLGERLDVA